MLYNIRLHLHYDYERSAAGGRHHIRVMPQTMPGIQRVIASSLSFDPSAAERSEFTDFFANTVTSIAYRNPHETLDVTMTARVNVTRPPTMLDVSPDMAGLQKEIRSVRSIAADAPHHFLNSTDYAAIDPQITAYAAESLAQARTVMEVVNSLNHRIYKDFTYDGEATDVRTSARQAFDLKAGVCQDFSHVMIAGLRGLGIPAGYVSGFLRTIPAPGEERLEGADAMHAWVRAWCGREAGWQEFDPTNNMVAGNDHITIGYGRDYADVSPIVGILKTSGSQEGKQSVDVIPLEP
ncbi:transglutaminase family protein [Phyllobacterium sp. BT25]|uniref:Transglutaminase family protein n=1 Tax=Phyllobacterium pellucidum TaxID=2740464 RepID=A0A849VN93_9HYPH|nr:MULTISPECIES: transglutaminase family protein [Phyllobacterium]NTS30259.1 transglutaminase family protein [Phyllobacterium pellucidum]SFI53896.1 Transglutaminase-like enzyme, putative cysteine protease [Phyllobacterium sp. CL33Tsu]